MGTSRTVGEDPAPPAWSPDEAWATRAPEDRPESPFELPPPGPAIAAWRLELTQPVEVTAPEANDIELVGDESLRAQVERCLSGVNATAQRNESGWWAHGWITPCSPPIDLAFDVFWRVDGREIPAGTLVVTAGAPGGWPLLQRELER